MPTSRLQARGNPGYAMIFPGMKIVRILFVDIVMTLM
jgi:hypothetical protein